MGNWTRAEISGTCPAEEVQALREALDPGRDHENFHCLVCGGAMGLPNWAAEKISAVGNLAERGYDANSIAETLVDLAKKAPGLDVVVHVGGDYESDECVASVVLKNGRAVVTEPLSGAIPEADPEQMFANLGLRRMMRR